MLKAVAAVRKDEQEEIERLLESIKLSEDEVAVLFGDASDALLQIASAGGIDALAQIGVADTREIVSIVNEDAVAYAHDRAAEMVGKKWVDGELIDNPNAEWAIDESTREMLRGTVEDALAEGISNDDLADRISADYAFSDARSETIARTETAFADVQGNLSAYKASGQVESKRWLISEDACDECLELEDAVVGIDEEFPDGGGDGPPRHPACKCDLLPVLTESDDSEE